MRDFGWTGKSVVSFSFINVKFLYPLFFAPPHAITNSTK